MSHGTAVWLFLAFGAAFAVKSPIWPLHTWSPITYAEAPPPIVELSALLAKLGSYGLLRFTIGLLPLAFVTMRPIILTLAVIASSTDRRSRASRPTSNGWWPIRRSPR